MAIFSRRTKSIEKASDPALSQYEQSSPVGLRLFTSICYLLAVVFLILVCIGNINGKAVIRDTWFLQINLSDLIPLSVPNAVLINSIARSIGLHDFYQVGLWSFCEGYNDQGVTYCSRPKTLYWFNPVDILLNELLAGATIALPGEVGDALKIVQTASQWMFGCFLAGTCLTFLCIFFAPMAFSSKPRWEHKGRRIFLRSLPITILTFLALLLVAGASVVATVMFLIFRNVFANATDLNIQAELGKPMLAFMWTASGFNLIGFLMQIGTCCGVCCCSGRKKAMRKSVAASESGNRSENENRIVEKEGRTDSGDAMNKRFGWKNRNVGT